MRGSKKRHVARLIHAALEELVPLFASSHGATSMLSPVACSPPVSPFPPPIKSLNASVNVHMMQELRMLSFSGTLF
jgi:hypothetical protein